MNQLKSWGRYPRSQATRRDWQWRHQPIPPGPGTLLAHGNGRAYGDVCLNDGQTLVSTRALNRIIHFDRRFGLLRAEAGVLLADVLDLVTPHGWFPPVVPGTKFVTLGGAVACDIHGKNHHRAGTIGRHITQLELVRPSSGERLICSPSENLDLYRATIGGLGLTGVISWVELRLKPIPGTMIEFENIRFNHVSEFEDLSRESDAGFEYTVAWIDTSSTGKRLGRGIFMRGNHAPDEGGGTARKGRLLGVPFDAPAFLLNPLTLKLFNRLYFHRQLRRIKRGRTAYDPFFFPLDAIHHWNRLYGKRGFCQHQCVVPDMAAIEALLKELTRSGEMSFLTILKAFGAVHSPGLLSFPRKGLTLTLDLAVSPEALAVQERLDQIVADCGGRLYAAKDARMTPAMFEAGYGPEFNGFRPWMDPLCSSSFIRRVRPELAKAMEEGE